MNALQKCNFTKSTLFKFPLKAEFCVGGSLFLLDRAFVENFVAVCWSCVVNTFGLFSTMQVECLKVLPEVQHFEEKRP